MKKLKRIRLSNINDFQLGNEQLVQLKGGYGNPCYDGCQMCGGAGKQVTKAVEVYKS